MDIDHRRRVRAADALRPAASRGHRAAPVRPVVGGSAVAGRWAGTGPGDRARWQAAGRDRHPPPAAGGGRAPVRAPGPSRGDGAVLRPGRQAAVDPPRRGPAGPRTAPARRDRYGGALPVGVRGGQGRAQQEREHFVARGGDPLRDLAALRGRRPCAGDRPAARHRGRS